MTTEPFEGISFACVCASNVNRSMEGHRILKQHGFNVSSYGTNEIIRMPGAVSPITYDFGSTYEEILAQIKSENSSFYEEQGLIDMLEKDAETKPKPERFAATNTRQAYYFCFTQGKFIYAQVAKQMQSLDKAEPEKRKIFCLFVRMMTLILSKYPEPTK